MALNPV